MKILKLKILKNETKKRDTNSKNENDKNPTTKKEEINAKFAENQQLKLKNYTNYRNYDKQIQNPF